MTLMSIDLILELVAIEELGYKLRFFNGGDVVVVGFCMSVAVKV
jgi:hypothetical protein